ncbi:MAG: transcriptional regulator [Flavobacteriaceae bacterium]|nr:transcriptional regulator [Flavobacteriaceae bacterium]
MVSIITGDIVNSRAIDTQLWLHELKETLAKYGKEPQKWEIFRGDSFQLEVSPEYALEAVVVLKATIKQFKELDIRIAIGVGEKTYAAAKITESNGSAFIRSGECFEQLKKQALAINTPSNELNQTLNLMFELASLTIDGWSPTSAFIIKTAIENPEMNQKELATILGMKQSNISRGLKRGGYDEIIKMNEYYKKNIQTL